jgi:hypothetical protein
MAKPRREKTREEKMPTPPTEQRVLPMQLQIGDRLLDETGEYEVVGWPTRPPPERGLTFASGANKPDVTMIRIWAAHEGLAVMRAAE